jgi:transposase
MGFIKRKTARKEHETPRRVRFCCLIEQGHSQSKAMELVEVPRTTAIKWLKQRPSDRRTGKARPGRPPIILDAKVKEIIEWMTGHFDRRAMPLQEIAHLHGIKACNDTILAAFARYGYHYHIPNCKPFLS